MNNEVLISTMNKNNKSEVIKVLKVNKCTIINQITSDNIKNVNDDIESNQKFISYYEKGLSKSRNKAIQASSSDILIIADDDLSYVKDYEEIIDNAYKKYPDADAIAFVVDNENKSKRKKILKEKKMNILESMKLQSVQLTFKKEFIEKNKLKFDERFGAGSTYYWGEENIFLFDCFRNKFKLYYVPQKIATLKYATSSTWDRTNDTNHYNIQGAIYYRMSPKLYLLLIIQFALRKRRIYSKNLGMIEVIKAMVKGANDFKKGEK